MRQHVAALKTYSTHRVHPVPVLGVPPGLQLERFDGIVIHYSLEVRHEGSVSPSMRRATAGFTGIKAMVIQDEYRHVDQTIAAMQTMGIHVVFPCARTEEIERVYPVLQAARRNSTQRSHGLRG